MKLIHLYKQMSGHALVVNVDVNLTQKETDRDHIILYFVC